MTILSRNFAKGASLLADAVRRPRLEEKDFDARKGSRSTISFSPTRAPDEVAARVVSRELHGDGHPYAWPVDGTPESLTAITLDRGQGRARCSRPPGSRDPRGREQPSLSETKAALEKALGDWKAEGPRPPVVPLPSTSPLTIRGPRVFLVDRPGRAADDRALCRARAKIRRSRPTEASPPRNDPGRQLHEPSEPEPQGEERLHVRRERPVRTRARARARSAPARTSPRRSPAPPSRSSSRSSRGSRAATSRGRGREGTGHREELRRAVLLGPLGNPRTATGYVELGAPFETLGEDLAAQAKLDARRAECDRGTRSRSTAASSSSSGTRRRSSRSSRTRTPRPVEVDTWGAKVTAK